MNIGKTSVTLVFFIMDKKLPKEIFTIQFLVLLSYSSLAILTLLPLFFEHLGGSPRQIGFLIGIFSFAAFLSRPFSGWILSRANPKKVMLAGLFIVLIALTLHLLVRQLDWFIIFLRIFHGIGFSLLIIAALLIAVLVVRENLRTYAIGVVSTGFLLPLLVVPALGEEIIKRYGFFFFFLSAIFFAAIPVIFALFLKFRLPQEGADDGLADTGFFNLLRQKKMFFIFLLTFLFEVALSASLSFVPLLALEGASMRAGYFYTSLGLTAVFLRLFGGRWLRFWGNPKLLLPALYLLCGGAVLVYLSQNSGMLAFSGFVWGMGTGVLYPHLSGLSVDGVAPKDRGRALSLFASSVDLGFALGPIIFGWLSQALGVREAFLSLALIIFVTSTGISLWGRSSVMSLQPDSNP
ncbi:MAG: MFS transporter [Candidatus Aminicenantes bacterium]|nr:MAG: MFS transporter [Candidatus Aminicenantes bacterium]